MSGSVNKVMLIGRLGADPELKKMNSGDSSVQINLATSERWRDRNSGEQRERTDWHRLNFYGRLADVVNDYCRKGSLLYVEGHLRTDSYDREGQTRYITYVRVAQMTMLDSRGDNQQGASASSGGQQPARASAPQQPQVAADTQGGYGGGQNLDDDIPF